MSTEALSIDQAVDQLMAPEEPAQESEQSQDLETTEPTEQSQEEEVELEAEDETEADYESEESDEYDADDESSEYEDNEPDQTEPEKITVKVDGEEVAVTLDDLKRSYSGQGKIQKGMQEAAEMRKQAEQYAARSQQIAQQLIAQYESVQQEGFIRPPQEPDQALFDSDPIGYMEAKMKYDQGLKEYTAQQQQIQQARQYTQQQQTYAQQQKVMQEMEILREKVPEFGNPEKAAKLKDDLMSTGSQHYGYSPEELQGVTDHRALMVLRDAMMWRRTQAKRSQAENTKSETKPVIKPQAAKRPDSKKRVVREQRSKLRKTGSIDDALSLIMDT